ncbi:MAG: hypothetical protein KDJ65_28870 [Anaerolineae bacterium]|nr:hypothetical protein [Anaerolineae bacterium]
MSHIRPSYRDGDPLRRLMAAIVLRAARDLDLPKYRASALAFLGDSEGQAWLKAFGISERNVRQFLEEND